MDLNFKSKSVAIVGSSGNLLDHLYGEDIDNHDIIIRFNQARVEGYKKHVGSRTDIRIMNTHTFTGTTGSDRFPKNDPEFSTKLKNQLILVNKIIEKDLVKQRAPDCKVGFIADKFWKYCEQLLENQKEPSVGFLGVLLAAQSTTNIDVYGFDQKHTVDRKHYWEKVAAVGNWHNFNIEKKVFKQLEEQKIIKVI